MKIRDVLIISGLLATATLLFFVFADDSKDGMDKDSGDGVTRSDSGRSTSSRRDDGNMENRTTKSDRVLKEDAPIITTESGLQYQVLVEGEGAHPTLLSDVKVHYVGTLPDGTVFDSSRERGEPTVFGLHQVIKGWGEGLQLMKPGAIFHFTIPANLAYGEAGAGTQIPPNATLGFEVELISIE